jgi:oxygen-independent coproporphyrinogen-3 oxidase
MLLYIHVPFCKRKCHYCSFHSFAPGEGDFERYTGLLIREIGFWRDRLGPVKLQTVYFGGGTPSMLPIELVTRIIEAVDKAFRLEPGFEFSFEANPDSVVEWGYLPELYRLGVNRVSLGVQSFNDRDLLLLGRPHSSRQAEGAYNLARGVGFENVSLDLIWGLPEQNLKAWMVQLSKAVHLAPTHLSCYALTLEPETPMPKIIKAQGLSLAPESEQAKMFIQGAEYLEESGYLQYEISNFARMGFASRHNMGYWDGVDYLGLGPSAVSTIQGARLENPRGLDAYAKAVNSDESLRTMELLDQETRRKEMVMLGLRTSKGLDLKAYRKLTGRGFLKEYESMVTALRQHELVRISGGRIRLTKAGMLVSDTILANFFDRGQQTA